jgi:hypothetical protein
MSNRTGEAQTTFGATAPEALEIVADFLEREGWPCERIGEQSLLRTRYQNSNAEWTCFAHTRSEFEQIVFYSIAPVRAPEVLRPAVVEYLTRANWGLILGNFEFDYGDGEVRFRTSIQLNGTPLTPSLLHPLIYGNVAVVSQYLPGLRAVIHLTQTPLAAIHEAESGSLSGQF